MNSDMRKFVRKLKSLGLRVEQAPKNMHLRVYSDNNKCIGTLSSTPSDHRTWRNQIAQLRRAGVNI